jgi:hypothetical protein
MKTVKSFPHRGAASSFFRLYFVFIEESFRRD